MYRRIVFAVGGFILGWFAYDLLQYLTALH